MGHFPYDAVVFDLDGTLFDAEEGIVSSVVKAMKEMGLEIPQGAQLRQVVGPPLRYSFHDLRNDWTKLPTATPIFSVRRACTAIPFIPASARCSAS